MNSQIKTQQAGETPGGWGGYLGGLLKRWWISIKKINYSIIEKLNISSILIKYLNNEWESINYFWWRE